MRANSTPAVRGVSALGKSALLLVGVPMTIDRLWLATPLPPIRFDGHELALASTWSHLILAIVSLLWLAASLRLIRDVALALRSSSEVRTSSWSASWAAAIAGLLFAAGVTSALSTSHRSVARSAVSQHSGTNVKTAGSPGAVRAVEPGECLADVARIHFGGEDDWPTLFRLNRNLAVAPGTRLVDPRLLAPGWCLAVPGAAPGLTSTAHRTAPRAVTHRDTRLEELAIVGLGLLGSAALVRKTELLRRLAECGRRPGERLPASPPDLGRAVAALRPLGEASLIDWVDAANRLLTALCSDRASPIMPDVLLVRAASDGIEVLLGEPIAVAPAPFIASQGGRWWLLDLSLDLDEALRRSGGAPRYAPWLIPVGEDASAVYLAAVGPGRRLELRGDDALVDATLNGIVTAIRVLPWADDLAVELVGPRPPDLVEQSYHLQRSSEAALVELLALESRNRLERLDETWRREPLIIVDRASWSPAIADLLEEIDDRAGAVVVGHPDSEASTAAGRRSLRLDVGAEAAVLWPFGISFSTVVPSPEQADLVDRLLEAAATAPEVVALGSTRPAARAPESSAAQLTATGSVDVRVLMARPRVVGLSEAPARESDRVIELLAYLALHGHRARRRDIAAAMFARSPSTTASARVENIAAIARGLLVRQDGSSRLVGGPEGELVLDTGVTCDWNRFLAAVTRARAAEGPEAVDLLASALRLVEGRPLSSVPAGYGWVIAEGIETQIVAEIVDAAHHLAALSLALDDTAGARWAIGCGQFAEPASEMLARDLLVTAHREGDHEAMRATFAQLEADLAALGGNEPGPETRTLFSNLCEAPLGS